MRTIDDKAIGQRIKAARLQKHLVQAELASFLGISVSQVSRIERGKSRMNLKCAAQISQLLEVPLLELQQDSYTTVNCSANVNISQSEISEAECMRELSILISDYYWDNAQHGDVYELKELQEAAICGMDKFAAICKRVFGKHVCEMYLSLLERILEYCEFVVENHDSSLIVTSDNSEAVVARTRHRLKVAELINVILSSSDNEKTNNSAMAMLQSIRAAAEQIFMTLV